MIGTGTRGQVLGDHSGGFLKLPVNRVAMGAGGAMTLRSTSPQAPRVVSRQRLMPAMVSLRFFLRSRAVESPGGW